MSRPHRRALGLLALALVPVLGYAPAAEAAAPTSGPGVCPTKGLARVTSTLSNGSVALGSRGTVTGSSGRACGVLVTNAAGALIARIQPANTAFAAVQTKVGLLSFPTTLRATSVLQGPTAFAGAALSARLSGSVVATADIMGQQCQIPLRLNLTSGRSGALTGNNFTPDAHNVQHGRLVDGTFAVPAIQPSPTCSVVVATLSNTLLGLPLAAGRSSVSYDAALRLR